MTQMISVQVCDLKDNALDWAIDVALGSPKIDLNNFDSFSYSKLRELAEDHGIDDSSIWIIEDYRAAFHAFNQNLRPRSQDTEWVSRLIDSEYISVTIGDHDVDSVPVVENWKARSLHDEINDNDTHVYGPTKDIAALRCFVASKLGLEIEVPTLLLPKVSTVFKNKP